MIESVDIVNGALTRIQLKEVNSLDEMSDRSLAGKRGWDICSKAFLEEYAWSWAITARKIPEVILTEDELDTVQPYRHAYALPHDFVRLVSVDLHRFDRLVSWSTLRPEEYKIRILRKIRMMFTFRQVRVMEFVCSSFDLTQVPASVREALELRLAMYLDVALKGGALQGALTPQYQYALQNALKSDGALQPRPSISPGLTNRVRHGR